MDYLEKYKEFKDTTPYLPSVLNDQVKECENCDFADYSYRSKDCYMVFNSVEVEKCLYSFDILFSHNLIDCSHIINCEYCYECCDDCYRCYQCAYMRKVNDCRECYFCDNCSDLTNCFGCYELENKQYYIFNEPYSKEEYESKVKELLKEDPEVHLAKIEQMKETIPNYPVSEMDNEDCEFIDNTYYSKGCSYCFYVGYLENCHYIFDSGYSKNTIDGCYADYCENCYMIIDSAFMQNCHHARNSAHCSDSAYIDDCVGCKNCFGCQGLRNKEFHIFNEPYSKEEYEKFLPSMQEAFNKMDALF